MIDVLSLGELVIDFLPNETGRNLRNVSGFQTAAGGAPANVSAAVSRLGGKAAFIGKVGQDEFGHFLEEALKRENVDLSGLVFTSEARTGIAFLQIGSEGKRSFLFYRHPSSDMLLDEEDLKPELFQQSLVFHYGSVTQISQRARQATRAAIELAKLNQCILSYDINLRPHLWPSLQEAKEQVMSTIRDCHILKLSAEEVEMLFGHSDFAAGADQLLEWGPKLVLITLGADGTYYRTAELKGKVAPYQVAAVDTTGAGDAFVGGFLRQLTDRIKGRSLEQSIGFEEELKEMLRYANAVGALTVTRMGAIPALPTANEVFQFQYGKRIRRPNRKA